MRASPLCAILLGRVTEKAFSSMSINERGLSMRRPNLRYVVGHPSERLGVTLKRLLPYKLYEWLAMRIVALGKWR